MLPHRLRFASPRRRFAWLLWLGLLLPVAQAMAMCHSFSHVRAAISGESDDPGAPNASHCDLCLSAAAIAGGAAVGELPTITHPAVRHEAPSADAVAVWLALPIRAYQGRAPPFASL